MKNNSIKISFQFIQVLIFLTIVFPVSSYALKGDEQQPIKIEADSGTADMKQMMTVFNGNVVITQGSLVIHADKATAEQDANGYRSIILYGKPVVFEQIDNDGGKIEGQGNQFNYNTKSNLALLTGRSRVKKGNNIIIANVITYNTKTQVYSATATPSNGVNKKTSGRITVILDKINNDNRK